jgi:hypothetical protein
MARAGAGSLHKSVDTHWARAVGRGPTQRGVAKTQFNRDLPRPWPRGVAAAPPSVGSDHDRPHSTH